MQLHYKKQRDVMFSCLSKNLSDLIPSHIHLVRPQGGMFIWLELVDNSILTSEGLFQQLAKEQVIAISGQDFLVPSLVVSKEPHLIARNDAKRSVVFESKQITALRLAFAHVSEIQIIDGMKVLSDKLRSILMLHHSKT